MKCPCGSNLESEVLYDGYGIYMTRACDVCRKKKLAKFRPDIFTRYDAVEPIESTDES